MLLSALVPALALPAAPARATATMVCDIDDRNLTFSLSGNVGRGDGADVQILEGSITLKPVRGRTEAIEFAIEPAHRGQFWTFDKDLRISVQTDAKDGVSLFLAIIARNTKSDDVDRYAGRYVVKINSPKGERTLKGRIKSCEIG